MSRYRIGMTSVVGGGWLFSVQSKPEFAWSLQSWEQPSPSCTLPSSHSSPGTPPTPGNTRPSPHLAVQLPPLHTGSTVQFGEQPSNGTWLPSSHCSLPSVLRSPQTV